MHGFIWKKTNTVVEELKTESDERRMYTQARLRRRYRWGICPPTFNFEIRWRLRKREEFSRNWTASLARATKRKYQSKTISKIYLSGSTRNSVFQNCGKIPSVDILEWYSLLPQLQTLRAQLGTETETSSVQLLIIYQKFFFLL